MADRFILPDVLADGLDVVFVGTAPGRRSAELGAYYAGPGNRFWPTLHRVGLTQRRLAPQDYPAVLALGIGLTDVAKTAFGADHEIAREAFDPAGLTAKLARYRPRIVAFTSKTGAGLWLGCPTDSIAYGHREPPARQMPEIFVLPSPSGRAGRYWSEAPWRALADRVASVRCDAADLLVRATRTP
jgi:TDG/mug DNA glycosylase family protein